MRLTCSSAFKLSFFFIIFCVVGSGGGGTLVRIYSKHGAGNYSTLG